MYFVALIGGAIGFTLSAMESPPIVSILEYPQCKEDSTLAVRVLFTKAGVDWIPLDTRAASKALDLRDVLWTVAFDGRSLGSIRTTDPGFTTQYEWTYPRDRLLEVRRDQNIPKISNSKRLFGGWCGSPIDRPLALVTPANYRDPDAWKPFSPGPSYRQMLFKEFKRAAGSAVRCPRDTEKPVPFAYTANNVVIESGYQDQQGRKLVSLHLDHRLNKCDGPSGAEWATQWFLITSEAQALGSGLELVDAGDYDADGKSEVLFWYSGYDKDGYTLFYDGFRRHADFRWIYH